MSQVVPLKTVIESGGPINSNQEASMAKTKTEEITLNEPIYENGKPVGRVKLEGDASKEKNDGQ